MPNTIIVIENPREFLETLHGLMNQIERLMKIVDGDLSTGTIKNIDRG